MGDCLGISGAVALKKKKVEGLISTAMGDHLGIASVVGKKVNRTDKQTWETAQSEKYSHTQGSQLDSQNHVEKPCVIASL